MPRNPSGNTSKHLSYTAAWGRISAAQAHGFHLEAVTLVESIVTDRLISFLVKGGFMKKEESLEKYRSLRGLISLLCHHYREPIAFSDHSSLQDGLEHWRTRRNHVVHGMVKSHPGTPTEPVENFIVAAEETATEGVLLAKALCNWIERERRRLRKLGSA